MEKIIGYARVSGDKQDLKRQLDLISDYCTGKELVRVYKDVITGVALEKKELDLLKSEVTTEIADTIVVTELSRIGRQGALPVLNIINDLLQKGINIVILEPKKEYKGGSNLDLIDIITLAIQADAARDEREKIAHRLKTGKVTAIANDSTAITGGNTAKYGFKIVNNPDYIKGKTPKAVIVPNEKELDVVKHIFHLSINDTPLLKIAEETNFHPSTISRIIKCPLYKGVRVYKGVEYPFKYKIIDEDTWNLANSKLEARKIHKDTSSKRSNPLIGKIFCVCGAPLYLKGCSKTVSYACATKRAYYQLKNSSAKCEKVGIEYSLLQNLVWNTTVQFRKEKVYTEQTEREISELERSITFYQSSLNEVITVDIPNKEKELTKLADDILLQPIQSLKDRWTEIYLLKEKELNSIKESVSDKARKIANLKNKVRKLQNKEDDLDSEQKRKYYSEVLDKVIWDGYTASKGVLQINYQNGIKLLVIVIKRGKNKGYYLLLPSINYDYTKRLFTDSDGKEYSFEAVISQTNVLQIKND